MAKFKIKELNRLTDAYSYTGDGFKLNITYDENDDKCIEIQKIKENKLNEIKELMNDNKDIFTNMNNYKIEKLDIDYQLLLLTFYNNLNSKLHKMTGAKDTLNNVKALVDEEMHNILKMATCRVITIDNEEEN